MHDFTYIICNKIKINFNCNVCSGRFTSCIYCFCTLKNSKTMTREIKKHTMDCTYLFVSWPCDRNSPIIQQQGGNQHKQVTQSLNQDDPNHCLFHKTVFYMHIKLARSIAILCFKLLLLTTLVKHVVGNPLINVH